MHAPQAGSCKSAQEVRHTCFPNQLCLAVCFISKFRIANLQCEQTRTLLQVFLHSDMGMYCRSGCPNLLKHRLPLYRLDLRQAEDRAADVAMVRMKHENVQLRAAQEQAAAELRQLQESRRTDPAGAWLQSLIVAQQPMGQLGSPAMW